MEIKLNVSTLSLIVTFGQFILVVFALILNIYIDDLRELARLRSKKEKSEKIFDWIGDPNFLYPGIIGILFILATIWATVITDDLKEKVRSAENRHTRESTIMESLHDETGR